MPGCRAYEDWRAAIEAQSVAVVIVATLHDTLAAITRAAVAAGRHVLVEKPAARNAGELAGLAELAARRGRVGREAEAPEKGMEPLPAREHGTVPPLGTSRPWSRAEKTLVPIFLLVVALWITPGILQATRFRDAAWFAPSLCRGAAGLWRIAHLSSRAPGVRCRTALATPA